MARKTQYKKNKDSAKGTDFDLLVAGGGPTGLAMAARAGSLGLRVGIIERADMVMLASHKHDGRTTALAYGSKLVFEECGIWDAIKDGCGPIRDIHVADRFAPMTLDFASVDLGENPFGYIVENTLLRQALHKRIAELKNVSLFTPASIVDLVQGEDNVCIQLNNGMIFSAKLLVAADGRQSFCRQRLGIKVRHWSYNETALICTLSHSQEHDGLAVERFYPGGPFAILPMKGKKSSIVWTEKPERASALQAMNEHDFLALLKERGAAHLGEIKLETERQLFPLRFMLADRLFGGRVVLIGEAAHAMHPIAGQGYNLSVRDIGVLGDLIEGALHDNADIGGSALLSRYESQRHLDHFTFMAATDLLVKLFSNSLPPIRWARQMGLAMVERLPLAKNFFSRLAMGLITS